MGLPILRDRTRGRRGWRPARYLIRLPAASWRRSNGLCLPIMQVRVDSGYLLMTVNCRGSFSAGCGPMRRHKRHDRGYAGRKVPFHCVIPIDQWTIPGGTDGIHGSTGA